MRTKSLFAICIVLSAFLLFSGEPLIGKMLLPRYGGGANVWTACLVFFQATIVAGYGYAFLLARVRRLAIQLSLHIAMLALAGVWLGYLWQSPASQRVEADLASHPMSRILWELVTTYGLPWTLLASTSPLYSAWWLRIGSRADAYAWYAWASLASLFACITYPFLIEPNVSISSQRLMWLLGTAAFLLCTIGIEFHLCRMKRNHTSNSTSQSPKQVIETESLDVDTLPWRSPTSRSNGKAYRVRALAMVALYSACTSILLTAVTSILSQAGTVATYLWMLPLAAYLATWSLAFRFPKLAFRSTATVLFYCGACGAVCLLYSRPWLPIPWSVFGFIVIIALMGIACHGRIYAHRPNEESLTNFYLCIAIGGMGGTCFVGLLAPVLFSDYLELHAGILLGMLLIAVEVWPWLKARWQVHATVRRFHLPAYILTSLFITWLLWLHSTMDELENLVSKERDFYGIVKVVDSPDRSMRFLIHGQTRHGAQRNTGPLSSADSIYYQDDSGASLAWQWVRSHSDHPMRVGIVGLGAGALSLHAEAEEQVTFYELSPAIATAAQTEFRYLSRRNEKVTIVIGDGRTLLQNRLNRNEEKFDLLLIDAFANDSIPMHLLTREAMSLYRSSVSDKGVIAFHVTNRYLDIARVVCGAAQANHLQPFVLSSLDSTQSLHDKAKPKMETRIQWVVAFPPDTNLPTWATDRAKNPASPIVWTDDFGSLRPIFK